MCKSPIITDFKETTDVLAPKDTIEAIVASAVCAVLSLHHLFLFPIALKANIKLSVPFFVEIENFMSCIFENFFRTCLPLVLEYIVHFQ